MPLQAKSGIEIHRRIEDGQPDDVVAAAVGRKERVIRYHRSWSCKCAVERPAPVDRPTVVTLAAQEAIPEAAPIDVDDPVAVATLAYLSGVSVLGIASAFGLDHYALQPDAPDFGLTGQTVARRRLERLAARADALERMRLHRPAQWATWVAEHDEKERQAALDSRLPRETWTGFLGDLIAHQSRLLTEADMRDWIAWVEDLAVSRYPTMVE